MDFFVELCLRGGDAQDPETRRRCGTFSGGMGLGLNILLFLGKLLAGILTSSVAMIADAVNNLSDAATSIVTLIGFRLAGQEADADHPFGHGRIEYITGLIVALAILLMGFEVGKSSLDALIHPSQVSVTPISLVILVAAIGVKFWMFLFNRALGRRLHSAAMEATAADSLSDMASTSVVLISALASGLTSLPIDGLAGMLVALLILKTGFEAVKDTIDPLLGRPMDPDLAADIDELATGHSPILGIHDLVYHDYGPGRAMMSFHAEVPANADFLEIHDIIDHIEREMKAKHHIETVIHMDPVVQDERTDGLRRQVSDLAQSIDPALSIHDFRITPGPIHTNLIFDVVVPYGFSMSDSQVCGELSAKIKALSDRYYPVIQVDHSYVDHR
ncbi:cation diffusion facilitator family transporter [Flavonifractor sp. An100]|uniref:cation diffusion facilitator family transporter n=1 Tax=Flavonifractor sp. An100 TaxID=1965538 RepID=UPI000B388B25|nr:cation diffusion facilitator family transporter [Flavonifractor sp. An100]OUQ78319.1 cation-efflux pump [Flavonifractor sp. An100]